jgi:FkbM family methyltransferase
VIAAAIRHVRSRLGTAMSALRFALTAARSIGPINALKLACIRWAARFQPTGQALWRLRVQGWPHPVIGRYGTSDLAVFEQIFIREEHRWARKICARLADMLILDCGANVGFSAIYFLRLFPLATVIAVEPDEENFAILNMNLEHRTPRVLAMRAAVWSQNTMLRFSDEAFRDGQHWARRVCLPQNGVTGSVTALTIADLLACSDKPRISILKMDIEGAEAEVFSADTSSWLPKTDAIAIELHDDTAFGNVQQIFDAAVRPHEFSVLQSGELTVALRK